MGAGTTLFAVASSWRACSTLGLSARCTAFCSSTRPGLLRRGLRSTLCFSRRRMTMQPWKTEPEVTVMVSVLGLAGLAFSLYVLIDMGVL